MRRSRFFTLRFLQKIPTISHIARNRLDEFFFLGICVCGGYWWSVFEFLVVLFPSCKQVCSAKGYRPCCEDELESIGTDGKLRIVNRRCGLRFCTCREPWWMDGCSDASEARWWFRPRKQPLPTPNLKTPSCKMRATQLVKYNPLHYRSIERRNYKRENAL